MNEDLVIKVRIKLAEKQKNQKWLAEQLGISGAYLSDILHGKRKSEEQINKIKIALEIK